ncbi:hypothetical protein M427DRAFT_59721 [Gonapodya prolifera JEL478]|uniref:Acyl-coenzyme A thioesterase THEM4 n=1 Tax=Gonapodya prolifera (strain JEL478) TaxID=1344416 RepID=A0A139A5Z1_GONPJ|nr:hypothetical protein M427DRAFT_59721 [Gonapodya prolifera JEL478]|eukprot:KXS12207.1 hypothetical protein M427DRAFT_59721 [Gonapodya prolifera JEL478]
MALLTPVDAPAAPLLDPSDPPFAYAHNLPLEKKFEYLVAVQPDARYFPRLPSGTLHPVLIELLSSPDLLPLKHAWTNEERKGRAANGQSRFYFRVDGRMFSVLFVKRAVRPWVRRYLQPSDWSAYAAEDARRRAEEPKPTLEFWGAGYFTEFCEGPPGFCHGGSIATFVDMILGFGTSGILMRTQPCRTLTLNVTYKQGVPLGGVIRLHAGVSRIEGRKSWPYCNLYAGARKEEDAKPLIMSEGLFVAPRNEYLARVGMEVHTGAKDDEAAGHGKGGGKGGSKL